MSTDTRRAAPPTTPPPDTAPPVRAPSTLGFVFLGLAMLAGLVALRGFSVLGGRDPQWFFPALAVALGLAVVFGILGGVMILRRLPHATWGRLISVSLVFLVGFLVLAGVNGIQFAYGELIAG